MWIDAARLDCVQQLNPRGCLDLSPNDSPDVFTLVESLQDSVAGSVGSSGDATLIRLVGEIHLIHDFAASAAATSTERTLATAMGIYIGDINQQNNVLLLSPVFAKQSKDWLWLGSFYSNRTVIAGNSLLEGVANEQSCEGTNANGSHIDVKVKRKIRKGEGIFLSFQTVTQDIFGTSMASAFFMQAQLRALVMLP